MTTLLEIHGRNDQNLIAFDDFSVVSAGAPMHAPSGHAPRQDAAIPEPGTFILLLGGLGLLAARARRRG